MAKQTINIGSAANDGTGDTARDAFDKVNDNFTELYTGSAVAEGTAILSTGEVGGTKFLREDGDGTSSWQAIPAPEGTSVLSTGPVTDGYVLTADGAGGAAWEAATGGGNVSNTGTPLDDQIAVWTAATTVEGSANLTFSATQFKAGSFVFNTDQTVGAGQDNYVLTYDNASGEISLEAATGGASQLSDLSDVNTSTPTNRNVLVADGVDWESRALTEADISDLGTYLTTVQLSDLTDVNTSTPTNRNVLVADGVDWESRALTEADISDLGTTAALVSDNLSVFAATTSAQLAGVISDETGSGALVFATSPTLVTPALGTPSSGNLANCTGYPAPEGTAIKSTGEVGGTKFLREDGDGTCSWQAVPGGGDALTSNPLSQFAATTSAQLAGVISDETGSGALVFATSPTLVTPALGTPSSGTLTNCTGYPINVVEDTTPQLGGNLDVQANSITTSTVNGGITLTPNGTGNVTLGTITIDADQVLGAGTDNYVLTFDNGTGLASFEAAAGGGGWSSMSDAVWTGGTQSEIADGATAIAFEFNTDNAYSTSGAKLLSLKNNGTEYFSFGHDDAEGFIVGTNATAHSVKLFTDGIYGKVQLGRKGTGGYGELYANNTNLYLRHTQGGPTLIMGSANPNVAFSQSADLTLYLGNNDTVQRTNKIKADLIVNRSRAGAHLGIEGGDAYDSGAVDRNGGDLILSGGAPANSGLAGVIDVQSLLEINAAFTVATLPTGAVGDIARVTDASSPTVGSTVTGGGATPALVWYDGTNWVVTGGAAPAGSGWANMSEAVWTGGTQSEIADGATAIAFEFNTDNAYSTAGANLMRLSNNGTAVFDFSFQGGIDHVNSGATTAAASDSINLNFVATGAQTSSAQHSVVIGINNTASGARSVVLGYANTGAGNDSFVTGRNNSLAGTYSAAVGYLNSEATSNASYNFLSGYQASVDRIRSAHIIGGVRFSSNGDAQTITLVAKASTTDATQTTLGNAGLTYTAYILPDTTYAFSALISARSDETDGNDSAAYRVEGCIARDEANNTAIVGTVSVTTIAESAGASAWDVTAEADDTNEALAIKVTGEAATNIRWVAKVDISSVTYA